MGFDFFGGSTASTHQTANNSQVTGSGSGILGIGSGTTINLGSTTYGRNYSSVDKSAAGKPVKGAAPIVPSDANSPGGAALPSPNNTLTITTADVNAIDLAAHAVDVNGAISGGAISAVGQNSLDLSKSAFASLTDLFNTALASNTHVFDTALASNTHVFDTGAALTPAGVAAGLAAPAPAAAPAPPAGAAAPNPNPTPATDWTKIALYALGAAVAVAGLMHLKK